VNFTVPFSKNAAWFADWRSYAYTMLSRAPCHDRIEGCRYDTALCAAVLACHAAVIEADSTRGERLFTSLGCIQCHSLNGQGGHIGPDLGQMIDRGFTPAKLAATMWHAPAMWQAMRGRPQVISASRPPRICSPGLLL
jgi:hypothetical protein